MSKRKKEYVVIDTETNSEATDRYLTEVFCIGIYFPNTDEFVLCQGEDVIKYLQYVLDEYIPIFHNSAFDIWVLEIFYGVEMSEFEDTMLASYCINPMGTHSLAHWGEFLGSPKLEHEDFTQFTKEMGVYCEQDCRLTWKVWEYLQDKIPPIYNNIDKRYIRAIIELETYGVRMDLEKFDDVIASVGLEVDKSLEEIYKLIELVPGKKVITKQPRKDETVCTSDNLIEGRYLFYDITEENHYIYYKVERFNPNSSEQIAYALRTLYGWEPTKFSSKTGKPTTDRGVLEELDYPLARLLVDYSEINKIHTTYGENLKSKINSKGILYANYNHTVTLTGRLSSSSPNLQNIPAKGERGSAIRSLFIAREGYDLVGIDIDQFQMRIFAWYLLRAVGIENLDAFILYMNFIEERREADPHGVTAKMLFGKDYTPDQRKIAKTVNFGILFGIGTSKLANQLKCSIPEAQKYLKLLKEKMPSVEMLKQAVWEECRENDGAIYTFYGRRGYYPDINSDDSQLRTRAERQCFNFLIQGTEADIIKLMQIKLKEHFPYPLVIQCHDEFIFEVPESESAAFAECVNSLFNLYSWLPGFGDVCEMQLTGTSKVGKSWNDIH